MCTSIDHSNGYLSQTNQIVWENCCFQISRFMRILEQNGLVALFHQLHPEPVYLLGYVWQDFLRRMASDSLTESLNDFVQELIGNKLLISEDSIDTKELTTVRVNSLRTLNRPTILYLMMAQGCNFACTYCPIPILMEQYGERLLSFEDAVSGIKLWQKHIADQPSDKEPYFLIFYGGEPLLNRKVLERLLPYVSNEQRMGRLPQELNLMLCTNGSLVDEHLSKLLSRYKVAVAIGIDGPRNHNDRFRIMTTGEHTFSKIENAIRTLVANGVKVVASVTITPSNVHQINEYPDLLRNLGISQFGFNLLKGEALRRELGNDGSEEEYCRLAAKGVVHGLADITDGEHCYEYQLEKKLVVLRNGLPFSVDCTCYGNQLVVQADGQVTNCPFFRVDQGHVSKLPSSFKIDQTEVVKKWRNRISVFDSMISTDSVLDGGGCAWSSSELHGDATTLDYVNKIFTKEVMYELIWTLLPKQQEEALRQRKSYYWSNRRIGPM